MSMDEEDEEDVAVEAVEAVGGRPALVLPMQNGNDVKQNKNLVQRNHFLEEKRRKKEDGMRDTLQELFEGRADMVGPRLESMRERKKWSKNRINKNKNIILSYNTRYSGVL